MHLGGIIMMLENIVDVKIIYYSFPFCEYIGNRQRFYRLRETQQFTSSLWQAGNMEKQFGRDFFVLII